MNELDENDCRPIDRSLATDREMNDFLKIEEKTCDRCDSTGWLEAIEGRDGSYITSRPCSCGIYKGL